MTPAERDRLHRAALAGAAAARIARSTRGEAYRIAPLLLEVLENDPEARRLVVGALQARIVDDDPETAVRALRDLSDRLYAQAGLPNIAHDDGDGDGVSE